MTDDRPPPPDTRESQELEAFKGRLRRAQGQDDGPAAQPQAVNARGLGLAFRMATEMVAALAVGGFIGWALDAWLGTRPWLLLVFLLLGMAAGTLNAFRESKRVGAGP